MNALKEFFSDEGIDSYGAVQYDDKYVINEARLARSYTGERKSLIAFAVPYYRHDERRNISVYAVPRDYHMYFDGLFSRMETFIKNTLSDACLRGFADTSPFDERRLAAACGIGERGDNGLIIHRKYGSYIFIGSIICDIAAEYGSSSADGGRRCVHCGACKRECPSTDRCLSLITQTKGELPAEQRRLIAASGCAWGCDICQSVCPANRDPVESPIPFFAQDRTPVLSCEVLSQMSDEEFSRRAYAWKGRACIMRNLEILENERNNDL